MLHCVKPIFLYRINLKNGIIWKLLCRTIFYETEKNVDLSGFLTRELQLFGIITASGVLCYHRTQSARFWLIEANFRADLCLLGRTPECVKTHSGASPYFWSDTPQAPGKKTNDFHAVRHSIIRSTPNILIALFILNAVKASEISPVTFSFPHKRR